ncbi:peptidoglycan-binding domain-containing protein [Floridanema evergladense]|uniref:Peptidoglycan-binding protein n=1 Tax=Floridaenema evergladense BLCC-F167 TaxID=3153639 RepID=A0ABV4WV06_9CYAN
MKDLLNKLIQIHQIKISEFHIKKVLEYCRLASRSTLSEPEADRMAEILELALSDSFLDFLINEADHFLAHHLDLIDKSFIKNEQAKLEVKLLEFLISPSNEGSDTSLVWDQDLSDGIYNLSKRLQQELKQEGFDPGPIDGVYGPRTQEALKKFNHAKKLDSKGVELPETLALLLH